MLEEGLSCSWMLWLYEFKEKQMAGLKIDIPESSNGMSDLLNQAKWGLDWMLKMQRPDRNVLHKVDGEDHFSSGPLRKRTLFPGTTKSLEPSTRRISWGPCAWPPGPSARPIPPMPISV